LDDVGGGTRTDICRCEGTLGEGQGREKVATLGCTIIVFCSPYSLSILDGLSANWLFVDLNSYFASVEQEMRPELRGQPIGIVPIESKNACVIAASY
jgi:hypothetical protein